MPRNSSRRTAGSGAIVKYLIEQEKLEWKAAKERDAEAFRRLVPADGIMIFRGGIMRQQDYVATMKSRTVGHARWRKIKGFMPNATTVILTYETVRIGSFCRKKFPADPVIESTTWIKRGRRWVAVLNQETPVQA